MVDELYPRWVGDSYLIMHNDVKSHWVYLEDRIRRVPQGARLTLGIKNARFDLCKIIHSVQKNELILTALHYDFENVFFVEHVEGGIYDEEVQLNAIYNLYSPKYQLRRELVRDNYVFPTKLLPDLNTLSLVSVQYKFKTIKIDAPLQRLYVSGLESLQGINLDALTTLHLPFNNISDLSPLRSCRELQFLDVSTNQQVDCDFQPLLDLQKLKNLSVSQRNLTPQNTGIIKTLRQRGVFVQVF